MAVVEDARGVWVYDVLCFWFCGDDWLAAGLVDDDIEIEGFELIGYPACAFDAV